MSGNYWRDTEEGARLWERRLEICARARELEKKYRLPVWYEGIDAPADYRRVLAEFSEVQRQDEEGVTRWAEAGVRTVAEQVRDFVQANGGSISFSKLRQNCPALRPWHSYTASMIGNLPGLTAVQVSQGYRIEVKA